MRGVAGGEAVVVGRHVYGNLYDCNSEVLRDEGRLIQIVRNAAKIANATLVSVNTYKFGANGGLTVFAIVAESHISVHTWPEHAFATVDVYTCGNTDPEAAFNYIAKELGAQRVEVFRGDRSLRR
ncbi:adenosylmethionine decarboxylase [Thermoproteus tenax]|uniref:S-adenosylmethionine decarboxylase proenzyme n=1 Tax=Thermoproteus tenax (strain ATCC 35583 / DSM 2078 / JCM 9277 / NBRC 100435 / Kra 1) TaxID=768679 RepID=G4RJF0_THETK|nr:adenosylmethionine decarboxylase [Thermoproteus tenax]CCC81695.1 S-adenosylmethionine decarboxylase [Thermoproteus tenax Kra 1]